MKKTPRIPNAASRHGKCSPGWITQGVQLPSQTRQALVDYAQTRHPGSIKIIATTAIELVLALPEDLRDELCREVFLLAWGRPEQIDGAKLLAKLKQRLAEEASS